MKVQWWGSLGCWRDLVWHFRVMKGLDETVWSLWSYLMRQFEVYEVTWWDSLKFMKLFGETAWSLWSYLVRQLEVYEVTWWDSLKFMKLLGKTVWDDEGTWWDSLGWWRYNGKTVWDYEGTWWDHQDKTTCLCSQSFIYKKKRKKPHIISISTILSVYRQQIDLLITGFFHGQN